MAIREKLVQRSAQFLEPGEQVHQVFMAQSGPSPLFSLLSYWIVLVAGQYAVVAVTDRAIVVMRAGKMTPGSPKEVIVRLPRATQLGPVHGVWGKLDLGGTRYWVARRFHKDVEAADAEISAAGGPPAT